jgi:type VI secretion system VasD/TssJ family lipoprotein
MLPASRRPFAVTLVAGFLLLAGGCCSINPLVSCTPRFTAEISAAQDLNSCTDQGSYPVKVRVYSLADGEAFRAADFERLWFEESDLGGSVLGQQTFTVAPGVVEEQRWARPAGTRLVGVVANFCRLESGCFKHLVEVPEGSQRLVLELAGTCLTVRLRD